MSEITSITGKVKLITEKKQVTEKFAKREIVIVTDDQYPQTIKLEAHQDNCDILDIINEGDNVTANYNLRGREWTNPQGDVKFFNTVVVWSIKVNLEGSNTEQIPTVPQNQIEDNEDTLPF